MSFITLKVTYQATQMQLNQKQYEEATAARTLEKVNEKLDDLESSCKSSDSLKNNSYYKELAAYSTAYKTKVASLNTEIELLQKQMTSFEKAMSNGIKESTSFWCFG